MKDEMGVAEVNEKIRAEWQKVIDDPDLDRVEAFQRGLKLGMETAVKFAGEAFDSIDVGKIRKSLNRLPKREN